MNQTGSEAIRIVALYADGRIIKGWTFNVSNFRCIYQNEKIQIIGP
jgi:hypothetical protein